MLITLRELNTSNVTNFPVPLEEGYFSTVIDISEIVIIFKNRISGFLIAYKVGLIRALILTFKMLIENCSYIHCSFGNNGHTQHVTEVQPDLSISLESLPALPKRKAKRNFKKTL